MWETIVRKTDSRLSKREDVVDCLPGARIEHVTEMVQHIMGRGNGGSILVHIGTSNAEKIGTKAIAAKYRNLLKKTKQARVGLIRNFTRVWKQEPRLLEFEEDGSQRDGEAASQGRGSEICGTALWGKKKCT